MSSGQYRISKETLKDISNIWVYTLNKWSKKQADRYFALIIDEIEFITDNYLAGRPIDHIRKNYRVTKIKSHLIFYRKVDTDIVEIVRILHQRMDVKKRLA
ncbi:MAG: toxin ParE1/3/4 [Bacteroidia bacterium]|jgi:toxin ParE1/3/4